MLLDLDPPRGGARAPARVIVKLLDVDAPEWEQALQTAPHDFYHLPAYVQLCAVEEGGDARAVYVSGEGKTMLLPLVFRDIPGSRLDAISPYGYPGPVGAGTEEPGFLRIALVAGVQAMREAGVVSAFVRLHPLMNIFSLAGVGTSVRHGETVSV